MLNGCVWVGVWGAGGTAAIDCTFIAPTLFMASCAEIVFIICALNVS